MTKNIRLLAAVLLIGIQKSSASFLPRKLTLATVSTLRGGGDNAASSFKFDGASQTGDDFIGTAYDWATNLGAPAALVAGAVIATLYENMSSGSLDVEQSDKKWVRLAKKVTRLLLVSAFILQIVCIFCTTILGTHLLSLPASKTQAVSALGYLKENFEFEYLTSRIAFIQGLITWIVAVALEHAIPQGLNETEARRRMDVLIASSLMCLVFAMLSFYNGHMNFYKNYFDMLCHYGKVTYIQYIHQWPPRVLTVLAAPFFFTSVVYFFKVFLDFDSEDKKTR